jgi:hypothetical protein
VATAVAAVAAVEQRAVGARREGRWIIIEEEEEDDDDDDDDNDDDDDEAEVDR